MAKKNKGRDDIDDPLLDPAVTENETSDHDPLLDPSLTESPTIDPPEAPRELTLAEINAIHREADRQAREAATKNLSDSELIIFKANEEAGRIIAAAKVRADAIIQAAVVTAQNTK